MSEAPEHFGRFLVITVVVSWVVGGTLFWWLRRRALNRLDRMEESTSEEMLEELDKAWKPRPAITIRTQTEYLPFLVESIREVIDRGLDDDQVICLQERFEHSRPNESRTATFTVETRGQADTICFDWRRDDSDRIELRVRAAPAIVRALKAHRRKIPKARPDQARR